MVGLAHGPNNVAYARSGYIFPEFGHGDYDLCRNGRTDDIMSYGDKTHFYNSTMTCAERFGPEWSETPAGDRFRADSAYHWNRIRYNLSLIHDEHNNGVSDQQLASELPKTTAPHLGLVDLPVRARTP